MAGRFFTVMVVPEDSQKIRNLTLPTIYVRLLSTVGVVLCLLAVFIVFDYIHVLSQVAENKRLMTENQSLRSDIQNAKNKLEALDQSVGRLKSFAHKLRILGNLDQPDAQRFLETPVPSDPTQRNGYEDHEDNGSIEEPEGGAAKPSKKKSKTNTKVPTPEAYTPPPAPPSAPVHDNSLHAKLEAYREQTVMGEIGPAMETNNLMDQVQKVIEGTNMLREQSELAEENFADLSEHLQDRADRLLATPSLLPARGWISSEFGYRVNPFSGAKTFHAGLDVANHVGTPVYAPADGLVTHTQSMGGFGLTVRIEHGYGIVTKYGHNSRVFVHAGQRIKRGDKIAEIGSSGRSTGPHVHYQVELKGRPVNPRLFVLEDSF